MCMYYVYMCVYILYIYILGLLETESGSLQLHSCDLLLLANVESYITGKVGQISVYVFPLGENCHRSIQKHED